MEIKAVSLNFQLDQAKLWVNPLFLDNIQLTDKRDGLDRENQHQALGARWGSVVQGPFLPYLLPTPLREDRSPLGAGTGKRAGKTELSDRGEENHPPLLFSEARMKMTVATPSSAVRDHIIPLSPCWIWILTAPRKCIWIGDPPCLRAGGNLVDNLLGEGQR